jgi:hypothetical protein
MDRKEWAKPISREEAQRRAAGRSKFHRWRKHVAELRRLRVVELFNELGHGRRVKSEIARRLCLDRGTICRDVVALRESGWDRWDQWQRQEMRSTLVAQIYGLGRWSRSARQGRR